MRKMAKSKAITVAGVPLVLAAVVLAWLLFAPARDASRPVVAVGVSLTAPAASAATIVPLSSAGQSQKANFLGEIASDDARRVADWAVASGDNGGLPFAIVDKIQAKVFVFDSAGRLRGATMALLGMARSDDSVPGIGNRKLSTIRPEERTTQAGRFVAFFGRDFTQDILWIDYATAISLHRVIPGKDRLQRLSTTSTTDKRVSYGCVNVPVKFYDDVVLKAFTGTRGIIYILPEIKAIQDVFPIFAGAGGAGSNTALKSPKP